MGKFKEGNIIKIIKIIPGTDDVCYGLHKGMTGIIEEIDPIDKGRYLVKFMHREYLIPMRDFQMAFVGENDFNYEPTLLSLQTIEPIVNVNTNGYVESISYGIQDLGRRLKQLNSTNKKEENNMKILELYKEKQIEKLNTIKTNKIEEVENSDSIQLLIHDTVDQLNVLLGRDENNKVCIEVHNLNGQSLHDDITETKVNKIYNEYDKKRHELDNLIEEVSALLELTDDYSEQIKILKNYDILNKGGKLNV